MYIRVKKRHDNHDFQPHALAFPSNLWWGKREWQSRAPYEISNPHTFFFLFSPKRPMRCIFSKAWSRNRYWRIRTTGIVWFSLVIIPSAQKRSSWWRFGGLLPFILKGDQMTCIRCRGAGEKRKETSWFTVTRNGTKTSGSRWCGGCPLN